MSEWVHVETMLPENGAVVLVVLKKKNTVSDIDVAQFRSDQWDDTISWRLPYCYAWGGEVTHWMPLPERP